MPDWMRSIGRAFERGLLRVACYVVSTAAATIAAAAAQAQVPLLPEEVERVDVIAIERDGRDVFAFDAVTGARVTERLELDEVVVFEASRGRIGLLLTDRRALAVASGIGFQQIRFGVHEAGPDVALVEARIAVLATNRRALAFDATGGWHEAALAPSERVRKRCVRLRCRRDRLRGDRSQAARGSA